MTAAIDRARRTLLRATAAIAAGGLSLPLAAQDPRSTVVQSAARDWLALSDRLDAGASWKAAGARFRDTLPIDRWTAALKQVREPLGALAARTVESTRFVTSFPGLPDGDYAVVVFRASFANRAVGRETVTLEHEGGRWLVVGYSIA